MSDDESSDPRGPAAEWDDEPVRIVPYDPSWPTRFDTERELLDAVIGSWVVAGIHHVGSTAVPGLAAKPVIDILVGVEDLPSARSCIPLLARHEYLYAPYLTEEMHWFCKPSPRARTHHLHLVPEGSPRFAAELAFRDRLREDPALADEYAILKHRLAAELGHDRDAYTAAKAGFIREAIGLPS